MYKKGIGAFLKSFHHKNKANFTEPEVCVFGLFLGIKQIIRTYIHLKEKNLLQFTISKQLNLLCQKIYKNLKLYFMSTKKIVRAFLSLAFVAPLVFSCGGPQDTKTANSISPGIEKIDSQKKPNVSDSEAVAYFSEGCFWHSEIVFQSLVGVRDAVSGYAGGHDPNPNYEKVCSQTTGHAETVEVFYDPNQISFKTLVEAFFASQDPTTLNRQGNDQGTEYRSIAFYKNEEEKKIIEDEIKKLTNLKKYSNKIVTEVKAFTEFYPAEDYHQEYIINNPSNGYVRNVSIPDFEEFRESFKGNFKK